MQKINLKRGPIAWMTNNSVAANLLMLVFLIGGILMIKQIKQEVFPDLTFDTVQIRVPYPGASPEEIESGIILAVEEAIRAVDGIKEITATANEGSALISAELMEGSDLQKLTQDIKSEVDRITTFPKDAEEPQVTAISRRRSVMSLAIYGDISLKTLHELAEKIRDQLLTEQNITQIDVTGIKPLEITIEISQDTLRKYNITLDDITQKIKNSSLELPGGGIKTQNGEILVRVKEKKDFGSDFRKTEIISLKNGTSLLLEDISKITDDYSEQDKEFYYNGKLSVILEIFRIGKQTPLSVADAVFKNLNQIQKELPPGIKIAVLKDRSAMYKSRLTLLIKNGFTGLILVLFVLGLFLELKLAFWVMLGIPISFLGSLLFLPVYDLSINMVSMFAYIIALGIVVDDAIVIGENIYYHHQNGKPFLTAAIYGAKELCVPVTFSILTNIVTFLPLLFLPGIMGKIFKTVPIVVCTVFLISLIESIFILPAHLSHQKEKKRRGIFLKFHTFQQKFSTWFISSVEKYFKPFLAFVLIRRYIAILIGMCILIFFIVYAVTGRMGFSMFPLVESDYSQMELTLPYGVDFEKTKSISKSIYIAAQKTLNEMNISKYVEGIVSEIGKDGGHTARIQVHFVGTSERKKSMSIFDFTNAWRKNAGVITGIDSINFASNAGGPGHGSDITIEISHRNISVLRKVSNELVNALENYSIVKDINDGYQLGKEQLDFKIKPEAKNLGLTATTIARQIRNSFYGSEVLRQQRGRNEIKIMVRLPKKERISEGNLENLLINTPYNTKVPLTEIVDIIRGRAYTEIKRRNNRRIIQVTASVTKKDRTNEILSDLSQKILPKLTEKYPNLIYSFEGKSADSRESMHSLKVGFTLALLGVFSLLAIPFKSYSQPLIIMISIPFGVIGAILGHMLMGYSLSVVGILGIVALSGVVVNDALVLIDASNRYVNSGLSYFQAVLEAAVQRFRPILLTTLTTFFGLVPMIFETDRAARFLIPMAISLGFGILFATFITLLLVPCLFIVFKDISILIDKYKCILNKFFNY